MLTNVFECNKMCPEWWEHWQQEISQYLWKNRNVATDCRSQSGRIKEIIFSLVDGQTSKVTHSDISLIFACPGLFVP